MRKFKKYFSVFFAMAFLALFAAHSATSAQHGHGGKRTRREPTEVLVKFKKNVNKGQVPELADGEEIGQIPQLGVKRIRVRNPRALAKLLEKHKDIEYIEPDEEVEPFLTPNDAMWSLQYTILHTIKAPTGWDITTGANSPIIAVVDSGVINNHPDLPPLLPGYAAVAGLSPNSDTLGHGTWVAGTIGMIGNNGIGGAGINWSAKILPVKIDDADGAMVVSTASQGVTWAADNGAKIMNCSWGTEGDSLTLRNAINYAYNKGVAIFASTGNDGQNTDVIAYPARYPNVMAVGGTTEDGTARAPTSQYGPGINVMGVNNYHTTSQTGGYSYVTGTSFATPQAAGLGSLILALKPKAKPDQVYDFIQRGAKTMGSGYNEQTGYGLIDIRKTLELVRDDTPRLCPCPCKGQAQH